MNLLTFDSEITVASRNIFKWKQYLVKYQKCYEKFMWILFQAMKHLNLELLYLHAILVKDRFQIFILAQFSCKFKQFPHFSTMNTKTKTEQKVTLFGQFWTLPSVHINQATLNKRKSS